jgi:hypothetical protein
MAARHRRRDLLRRCGHEHGSFLAGFRINQTDRKIHRTLPAQGLHRVADKPGRQILARNRQHESVQRRADVRNLQGFEGTTVIDVPKGIGN